MPGAVVSPGHTKRLSLLPCRAPHNSPCTLMPYLAQTDGAYSAACGRRVPSRQKPQALSMTSGLLRRTGSRPCSRPSGSPSVPPSIHPHPQKKEPQKGPKTRSAPVVAYRGDYYEKNCMCNDTDTHHYSVFRNVLSNYPYTTRQI